LLRGHGGNRKHLADRLGCAPEEITDMSSNINPLGPPPRLIEYLKENIDAIGTFPEVDSREIAEQFANQCRIDSDRVLAGHGTTQFIYALPQALGIKTALIVGPTYSDYADACHLNNVDTTFVIAEESQAFQPDTHHIRRCLDTVDSVFICNPNNPTGSLMAMDNLKELCRCFPNTLFVVDESYLSFIPDADEKSMRHQDAANLIVLVSISKIFAIPGLRVWFVVSSAERIARLRRFLQPWSVNSLAQLASSYLMMHRAEMRTYIDHTHRLLEAERSQFVAAFDRVPNMSTYPSTTNYLIVRLPNSFNAATVCSRLAEYKILVRNCSNFEGLSDRYIRISLKQPESNRLLARKLIKMAESETR
jgi:threonine-phosphate decarboxylase